MRYAVAVLVLALGACGQMDDTAMRRAVLYNSMYNRPPLLPVQSMPAYQPRTPIGCVMIGGIMSCS